MPGEWWAVFLGCRPYAGNHFNTGRESFLAPVTWTETGWPRIDPGHETVQYQYPLPRTAGQTVPATFLGPNVNEAIGFDRQLDMRWLFLRNVATPWYDLDTVAGTLRLQLRPEVIAAQGNPSLMLRRQPHLYGEVQTHIDFVPARDEEMAGLLVLQNERHYYFVNKAADKLQVLKQTADGYETLAETPYAAPGVHLRITADGRYYHFDYSADGKTFAPLLSDADATYLSTETAGGFIGCMYGLYATSRGAEAGNHAVFDYLHIVSRDSTAP
ncbi:MAG: hypothetical protein OHK0039_23550 [Bacteroidia bacterium]